jgi:hypothetical protein
MDTDNPTADHMLRVGRTAVLVVHGMGIQRPLETVRGIVKAIWLSPDNTAAPPERRTWTHLQADDIDIDLPVITTNAKAGAQPIDFHELYWSHLMSETPAVAVLLWLFELVRKGPSLRVDLRLVWWSGAIFISFIFLSTALITVRLILWFSHFPSEPRVMIFEPVLFFAIASLLVFVASFLGGACRLAGYSVGLSVFLFCLLPMWHLPHVDLVTSLTICPLVAAIAVGVVMGRWGIYAFIAAYSISLVFYLIFIFFRGKN